MRAISFYDHTQCAPPNGTIMLKKQKEFELKSDSGICPQFQSVVFTQRY